MNFVICKGAGVNQFCITQNRDIGIMRGEKELNIWFHLPDQLNYIFIDGLVIQIILWLIDDNNIIFFLADNKQNQSV